MTPIFLSGTHISNQIKGLIRGADQIHIAVAWGSDNPLLPLLVKNHKKIYRLVVGTHFYQTSPGMLEQVMPFPGARVMSAANHNTFHPKVYLFCRGDNVSALIGSANFTNGGLTRNVEACLLFEGTRQDSAISDLLAFVDSQWALAKPIDDDFLRDYKLQYDATKVARTALGQFVHFKRPAKGATKGDPLEMTWRSFVAKIEKDQYRSLELRLKVLREARKLISKVASFSQLDEMERKAFAGTLGPKEKMSAVVDWAWFGSMFGAGVFKNRIKENHPKISAALDAIPLQGPVTKRDYEAFVAKFQSAFSDDVRRAGIAPASRLLAMKRPDYFVCYDSPNRSGISTHFGVAMSAVRINTYWDQIIEPMMHSSWWLSPRPGGREGEIWDGRAAFLDAIYLR